MPISSTPSSRHSASSPALRDCWISCSGSVPTATASVASPDGLTLARVAEHEHGLDLGPLEPALPGKLSTASGRVELAPPRILDDLPRLDAWLEEEPGAAFTLIGRRDPRSMNSWLHNSARLLRGRERCTVHVHPDDAHRLGLRAGDAARLCTEAGELIAPVELSDRLMPASSACRTDGGTICRVYGSAWRRAGPG